MRYNPPYGISDPEGPYINGDPSIGRAGSIPPAESIEYPQREVVNLIKDVNLFAPDNGDLHQLAKAVQSMLLISDDDAGTSNQYQVTMTPAPIAYFKYMTVVCKIGNTNTGPSVLNCNALGPKPIRHPADNSELQAGELKQNSIACFIFDGAFFHLVWSSYAGGGGSGGGPVYLVAPRDLYVNGATGHDTNYDGSSATVVAGTNKGPFATPQRAANECIKFNMNGFSITVHVANGTYGVPNQSIYIQVPSGQGMLYWEGNTASPANVTFVGTNRTACQVVGPGACNMAGFKYQSSGSNPGDPCCGLFTAWQVHLSTQNIEFGQCSGYQMGNSRGSSWTPSGNLIISGGSTGNPYAAAGFINCFFAASVETSPSIAPLYVSIPNAINIGTFVNCSQQGVTNFYWSSLTGAANVTGQRFNVAMNGVINTSGGGVNYYPGTVAGVQSSGGQYV